MPRGKREFEIDTLYHAVNRGVEKRTIFRKNQDYSRFILGLEFCNNESATDLWTLLARVGSDPTQLGERIRQEREKNKERIVELLAFALMPNHYHLIIREIVNRGISAFMQKMGGYSTYFNKQHNRVGPLFQSRYKAVPIKTDVQLHTVFAYVHTNPVALKEPGWKDFVVKNESQALAWLNTYRWSSYQDYTGRANFPEVTQRDFFMRYFGNEQKCAVAVEDWVKFRARKAKLGGALGPEILE